MTGIDRKTTMTTVETAPSMAERDQMSLHESMGERDFFSSFMNDNYKRNTQVNK